MANNGRLKASTIRFVNLAGHDVNLGNRISIPKETKPARILNERVRDGALLLDERTGESIPIYKFDPGSQIVGLPDPEEGVVFIVSPMVRKELTTQRIDRPDVVSPYAVEVRRANGERVQCAKALAR
jgi:hypothetical protein